METYPIGTILLCDIESLAYCKGLKTTIQRIMREFGLTGYVQKVFHPDNSDSIAKTIAVALGHDKNIQAFVAKMKEKLPNNASTSIKILGTLEQIGTLDLTNQELHGPCIRPTSGKIKSTPSDEGNIGDGKAVDMTKDMDEGILSQFKKGALTAAGFAKYIPGISKEAKDLGSAISDTSIHDDPTYTMTARSLFTPTCIVIGSMYAYDPPNIARALIERDTGIPFEKIALYTEEGVEIRKPELLKKKSEVGIVYVDLRQAEAFFSTPAENAMRKKFEQYIKGEWFYHCLAANTMTVAKFKSGLSTPGVSTKDVAIALAKDLSISEFNAYVVIGEVMKL